MVTKIKVLESFYFDYNNISVILFKGAVVDIPDFVANEAIELKLARKSYALNETHFPALKAIAGVS